VVEREIRDRIKELRRVKASELVPNPKNWRRHPKEQSAAMRGLLNEIGYAGALLARELPDGKLQLIDGHLRLNTTPKATVPVLVLDVTEAEADKILLTFDPISAMAQADQAQMEVLLATVRTEDKAIAAMLERVAGESAWQVAEQREIVDPPAQIDKAAELQAKWATAPGQAWQIRPYIGSYAEIAATKTPCGGCGATVGRNCEWCGPIRLMVSTTPLKMPT